MSNVIDTRIVDMKFNNASFEQGAAKTMSTLEKLEQKLNIGNKSLGIDKVNTELNKLNLKNIESDVGKISNKFTLFGNLGYQAIEKINAKVIELSSNLIKTFLIKPVSTGFNEYELKLNSMKIIMASTGASLETVKKYLEDLNVYSDKTIYSFKDMTDNIGKFTNAGVNLDDSVNALKGISNEAALSGANTAQASHAMYNFAQALQQGVVRLIDWRSIENAQMATVEFKDELLKTAEEVGTVAKTTDGYYKVLTTNGNGAAMKGVMSSTKDFNASLQYQWLTSEVLIETLKRYADETTEIGKKAYKAATEIRTFTALAGTIAEEVQSNFARVFEIVIGDFDEAKDLWGSVSNVLEAAVVSPTDSLVKALEKWKNSGGREAVLNSFKNIFEGVKNIAAPFGNVFDNILPSSETVGKKLAAISKVIESKSKDFSNFTNKLKDPLDNIGKNVTRIIDTIYSAVSGGAKKISPSMKTLTKGFEDFLGSFTINGLNGINKLLEYVADKLPAGIDKLSGIFDLFLGKQDKMNKGFDKNASMLEKFAAVCGSVISVVFDFGKHISTDIIDAISTGNVSGLLDSLIKKIGELKNTLTIGNIFDAIGKLLDRTIKGTSELGKVAGGLLGYVLQFGSALLEFVNNSNILQTAFKALTEVIDFGFDKLLKVFDAITFSHILKFIAILLEFKITLAAFKAISIPKDISVVFKTLKDTFKEIQSVFEEVSNTISKVGSAIKILSVTGLILTLGYEVGKFSEIPKEDLTKAMIAVGLLGGVTVAMVECLSKVEVQDNMLKEAALIIALAIAMKDAAKAVSWLGEMKLADVIQGVIAYGVLMAEFAGAMYLMSMVDQYKGNLSTAATIIALGIALNTVCDQIEKLNGYSIPELIKTVTAIGILLTAIAGLSNLAKGSIGEAATILSFGKAMEMLTGPIQTLGALPLGEIAKGIAACVIPLVALAEAINLISKDSIPTKMVALGFSVIELAAAMKIMEDAMFGYNNISWKSIVKGLTSVGVALGILVAAMKLVADGGTVLKMVGLATACIILAEAMNIMTIAMLNFKDLEAKDIAGTIISLAAAIGILVGLTALVTAFAPAVIAAGAALIVFGAGLAALGGGILVIEAALTGFLALGNKFIEWIVGVWSDSWNYWADALRNTKDSITDVGGVFNWLITVLLGATAKIFDVIGLLPGEIGASARQTAQDFRDGIAAMHTDAYNEAHSTSEELTKGLGEGEEKAYEAGSNVSLNYSKGIADNTGYVKQAGTDMNSAIYERIRDDQAAQTAGQSLVENYSTGIQNEKDSLMARSEEILNAVVGEMSDQDGLAGTASEEMLQNYIGGIDINQNYVEQSANEILETAIKNMTDNKDYAYSAGGDISYDYSEGLSEYETYIQNEANNLLNDAIKGITDNTNKSQSEGKNIGQNYAKGISSEKSNVRKDASDVKSAATDSLKDNNNSSYNAGDYISQKYGDGIKSNNRDVYYSGTNVKDSGLDGLKDSSGSAYNSGSEIGSKYADGIWSYNTEAYRQGKELSQSAINGAAYSKGSAYNTGGDIGSGFVSGIRAWVSNAWTAGYNLIVNAINGARDAGDINSPSKKFKEIAKYCVDGFVNEMNYETRFAADSGYSMMKRTLYSVNKALTDEKKNGELGMFDVFDTKLDINPTIVPTVDTTYIDAALNKFKSVDPLSVDKINISAVNANRLASAAFIPTAAENSVGKVENTFVQNNYSPKALDRKDIYMNTKTQFSNYVTKILPGTY